MSTAATAAGTSIATAAIPGLYNKKRFISEAEEAELLDYIYQQPWNTTLSRRTQHYGYLYDYNNTSRLQPTTAIPDILLGYKLRIETTIQSTLGEVNFDQCIINEYTKQQGIAPHVDHVGHFGPIICSLSLGSPCTFEFSPQYSNSDGDDCQIILDRGELLALSGKARYDWKHSIPRSSKGRSGTRVSITFRCVNK